MVRYQEFTDRGVPQGVVRAGAFRRQAQEAVVGMEGVRQVVNEIEVVW